MTSPNELHFLDLANPVDEQGFRTILVTNSTHPYEAAWWPPRHIIGYEHTFVHAVFDFLTAIEKGTKISSNFYDGMKAMQILEAAILSSTSGRKITVSEVKQR